MTLVGSHLEDLQRSGLSMETIQRAGLYSAPERQVRDVLGYGAGPGLVFPYASLNGSGAYCRVKLDKADAEGKRYRSPKGAKNRLYIPPDVTPATLKDAATALWITEGEKKSLKAAQEGLSCVALPGVWSWRTRGAHDKSITIPDLDHVAWPGRTVYIVFDSDLATNPSVKLAEFGLAQELRRRGAKVLAVRLPAGPRGQKVGLDDYLLTHSVEALCQLEPVEIRNPAARELPSVVTVHELLTRTYPERPAIVGGGVIVRQSLCVAAGPPKVGKSMLVKNIVLCRTTGRPWLGFDTTPGRSLVIQAEIPERELQTRLRIMLQDGGAPLPEKRLWFVTHRGMRLDRSEGLKDCRRLVEEVRPDLLVIDPLARFFGGDENSAREVGRVIGSLDDLIQTYGLAVLLVHHTAKPQAQDPREGGLRLRGSSALFGAVDTVMLLDRTAGADRAFKLTFELRHGKEPPSLRLLRSDHLWFGPAGPPEELLAVAALVADVGLKWTALQKAIAADQSVSARTAARLIEAAAKAGVIAKNDGDVYRATATRCQDERGSEVSGGE